MIKFIGRTPFVLSNFNEMQRMAKNEPVNKSEFIKDALGKNPDLNHQQINALWVKRGGEGEISRALFFQVKRKMGLKRAEYRANALQPRQTAQFIGHGNEESLSDSHCLQRRYS